MSQYIDIIGETGLMPAVTINRADNAIETAKAFLRAKQNVAEVTMRTEAAEESIRLIAENTELIIGAGTVHTIEHGKKAIDAGAKFLVCPGFNLDLVKFCQDNNIEIIPGVATPTEIEMALNNNINVVKFFPADLMGGPKMLKALEGPYHMMKFIPMGGINASNMREYLSCSNVYALGGPWMAKAEIIDKQGFDYIEEMTLECVRLIKNLRSERKK